MLVKIRNSNKMCYSIYREYKINKKGGIIMLKFQNNNTITIATFEDFILTAFVIIFGMFLMLFPKEGMF